MVDGEVGDGWYGQVVTGKRRRAGWGQTSWTGSPCFQRQGGGSGQGGRSPPCSQKPGERSGSGRLRANSYSALGELSGRLAWPLAARSPPTAPTAPQIATSSAGPGGADVQLPSSALLDLCPTQLLVSRQAGMAAGSWPGAVTGMLAALTRTPPALQYSTCPRCLPR